MAEFYEAPERTNDQEPLEVKITERIDGDSSQGRAELSQSMKEIRYRQQQTQERVLQNTGRHRPIE